MMLEMHLLSTSGCFDRGLFEMLRSETATSLPEFQGESVHPKEYIEALGKTGRTMCLLPCRPCASSIVIAPLTIPSRHEEPQSCLKGRPLCPSAALLFVRRPSVSPSRPCSSRSCLCSPWVRNVSSQIMQGILRCVCNILSCFFKPLAVSNLLPQVGHGWLRVPDSEPDLICVAMLM